MSGQHRRNAAAPPRTMLVVLVGIVLLAAGIVGARAMMPSGSEGTKTAQASNIVGAATATSAASSAPTSSQPGSETPQGPPAALVACRAEVAAGDALARATHTSWTHWAAHTGAQVSLDRGRTTLARTQAIWASSKATASQDLADVASAQAAYTRSAGACAKVGTVPSKYTAAAAACSARGTTLAAVAATGAKVNADWAAHVTMMASKAHANSAAYHARWLQMVKAAPVNQVGFHKAYGVLAATAPCPALT